LERGSSLPHMLRIAEITLYRARAGR
jgi:hypothetical protein